MQPAASRLGALFALILSAAAVAAAESPSREGRMAERASLLDQKGERTTLKTAADNPFAAYVVGPKDAKRGILIIPASARLDAQAEELANRFAARDYRAIAIELGEERPARDPAVKGGSTPGPDQNEANAKYRAAFQALRDPGRKLAAFGSCAGGGQALEASLAAPDLVSATVLYFGAPVTDVKRLTHLKAPVLVIVATGDSAAGEKLKTFEGAMRQAGKTVEVRRYASDGSCANPGATPDGESPAWQAMLDFLNRYLQ